MVTNIWFSWNLRSADGGLRSSANQWASFFIYDLEPFIQTNANPIFLMIPAFIELNEYKVIGISVRTTNQNGQSQIDIGELWGRFMIEKIPDKVTSDIYCVYTDYESDFNGKYTTILGCKVTTFQNIPEGFISKIILGMKYLHFQSKGKLPDCVIETWKNIWKSDLNRKYDSDFDVYGQKAQNPEDAVVDTYVSVR